MSRIDLKTQELIAIGVSFAINCQPCMDYHKGEGLSAGLSAEEMLAAINVAEMVRNGAHKKSMSYAKDMFGTVESGACCPVGSECCS